MYAIYADNSLLYSPLLVSEGYSVLNPKLTLENGKAGSLTFTLPPNNPLYNSINKLKTRILVTQDNVEIFSGRVLHDEKNFNNLKSIYCEGELSYFVDSVARPYEFQGSVTELFAKYVTEHNEQVEDDKRFKVGRVTVTDPNDYIVRASSDYPSTLNEMNEKLIGLLGGHFEIRKDGNDRYIDYLAEYSNTCNQVIEFGVNLLDLNEYISADEVFTVLIPTGKEGLTIKDVNGGLDYIEDSTAIGIFGRVVRNEKWDDVTLPENLLTKARAYLSRGIEMAVSLTMNAIDLHLLNVEQDRISIGDMVRVVSLPHGLDKYFLCSKINLDLVNPDNNVYTFGYSATTITEQSQTRNTTVTQVNANITEIEKTVDEIPNIYVTKEEYQKDLASNVHIDTTANWNIQPSLIGEEGHIYVYTDYEELGDGTVIPAVKIGDGKAYLIDSPFVDGNATTLLKHINNSEIHVTQEERLFWNEKVRCFLSQSNNETLIFTTS